MRKTTLSLLLCALSLPVYSQDHTQHDAHGGSHSSAMKQPALTEPGNAIFGTIQEVIHHLQQNPDTDWSKVDLEALRQHLLDMKDIAENVEVLEKRPINQGVTLLVAPLTSRAEEALERVLAAHPEQLRRETGWEMIVGSQGDRYRITTTSEDPEDTAILNGLGYIGLMAYGNHHQPHHWAMGSGQNPHQGHH
ncbi:hypothetical protein [Marinobacter sp.]|uniref:hypothetical protein n=1 Tax=Marinobacter sp. TaxID=50741 RepID=UPI0035616899